jgi:hypothetical protein
MLALAQCAHSVRKCGIIIAGREARARMQSEVSAMRRAIPVERTGSRDFGR